MCRCARMHELVKLYREAERSLREFNLKGSWCIEPNEKDGRGWGATEAIRGAPRHWIDIRNGKIKNYRIVAPVALSHSSRYYGACRKRCLEPPRAGSAVHDHCPCHTSE